MSKLYVPVYTKELGKVISSLLYKLSRPDTVKDSDDVTVELVSVVELWLMNGEVWYGIAIDEDFVFPRYSDWESVRVYAEQLVYIISQTGTKKDYLLKSIAKLKDSKEVRLMDILTDNLIAGSFRSDQLGKEFTLVDPNNKD